MSPLDQRATEIAIVAEPSRVDPNAFKFVVDRPIHPGGPFVYANAKTAEGSPLPARLFSLQGIAGLLVDDNVVSVTKTAEADWQALLAPIGQAIREQLLSGVAPIVVQPRATHEGPLTDDETATIFRELLSREVNPQIAGHGGKITLERVEAGTAYVTMGGGCQGCAASSVTLRHGMEVIVHRVLPHVKIVDVTNHTAGTKPFFTNRLTPSDARRDT